MLPQLSEEQMAALREMAESEDATLATIAETLLRSARAGSRVRAAPPPVEIPGFDERLLSADELVDGAKGHEVRSFAAALCDGRALVRQNAATALGTWAMVENEHFEKFVRIQTDRNHRVVTTGPYRAVRHPGYLAGILGALASPLMLGSVWSTIPALLIAALFVWRTSAEDTTLQRELDGYAEYAAQTPHRLIPFLW